MNDDHAPFWRSLPGILTGIAAVLVAVGGLWAAIIGVGPKNQPPPPPASGPKPSESLIFSKNLVTNGDAESGCLGHQAGQPVPGWTATPEPAPFTTEHYGAGGFPLANITGTGDCLFAGGPADTAAPDGNKISGAMQLITLGRSDTIAEGKVSYQLSALLGGYSTFPTTGTSAQDDQAAVTLEFLDMNSDVLDSTQIGPVTDADRDHTTTLLPRRVVGTMPSNTYQIRITVTMTKQNIGPDPTIYNGYNDGYADNISLVLTP
jgi:hypothetical protein